jgi:hypothetical protein
MGIAKPSSVMIGHRPDWENAIKKNKSKTLPVTTIITAIARCTILALGPASFRRGGATVASPGLGLGGTTPQVGSSPWRR